MTHSPQRLDWKWTNNASKTSKPKWLVATLAECVHKCDQPVTDMPSQVDLPMSTKQGDECAPFQKCTDLECTLDEAVQTQSESVILWPHADQMHSLLEFDPTKVNQ